MPCVASTAKFVFMADLLTGRESKEKFGDTGIRHRRKALREVIVDGNRPT